MPLSSQVVVRRATTSDAPEIGRLTLEVHAAHVAGRPDLFKPGGVESIPQIAVRISEAGQFYWVAVLGERVVGYAHARRFYERMGFSSFHERMAVEVSRPDG